MTTPTTPPSALIAAALERHYEKTLNPYGIDPADWPDLPNGGRWQACGLCLTQWPCDAYQLAKLLEVADTDSFRLNDLYERCIDVWSDIPPSVQRIARRDP